jgi:hypothetical protein
LIIVPEILFFSIEAMQEVGIEFEWPSSPKSIKLLTNIYFNNYPLPKYYRKRYLNDWIFVLVVSLKERFVLIYFDDLIILHLYMPYISLHYVIYFVTLCHILTIIFYHKSKQRFSYGNQEL